MDYHDLPFSIWGTKLQHSYPSSKNDHFLVTRLLENLTHVSPQIVADGQFPLAVLLKRSLYGFGSRPAAHILTKQSLLDVHFYSFFVMVYSG